MANFFNDVPNQTLIGTEYFDLFENYGSNSSIYCAGSSDRVFNFGANSSIYGGEGGDAIESRGAFSFVDGGEGGDSISNFGFNSTIYGGAGADHLDNLIPGRSSSMDGGSGDDYLTNYGGSSTIRGGSGNDYIQNKTDGANSSVDGGEGNDTVWNYYGTNISIDGGEGNDTVWNFGADSSIYGGEGNDTVRTYGANCSIDGGKGDDFITSVGTNSVITGGMGNDVLTVGPDATRFMFAITASQTPTTVTTTHTQTFAQWLAPLNLNLDQLTQSQFSTQYVAWVKSMVAATPGVGADVNGDGVIAVDLNQNDPTGLPIIEGMTAAQVGSYFNDSSSIVVKSGKTTQERFLAKQFTTSTNETVMTLTASSADGHDTIHDFIPGEDTLNLQLPANLTLAQVKSMLSVSLLDADGDGAANDTRIAFTHAPNDWSVTLIGVTGFSLESVVAA